MHTVRTYMCYLSLSLLHHFAKNLILHHKVKVSFSASYFIKTHPAESCTFLLTWLLFTCTLFTSVQKLLLCSSNLFLVVLPNLNISLIMFLLPATAQNSVKNSFLKYPLDPKPHLSEDCNVPNHLNLLLLIPRVLINPNLSSFCSISKYLFKCSSCFFLHILFVLPNYNIPIPQSTASLINLRSQIILHYSTNSTLFQESLCTVRCTTL